MTFYMIVHMTAKSPEKYDVQVYGLLRIVVCFLKLIYQFMVFCCFQNEPQDLLFILTARYRVFILSYRPDTGDIVTRACGDVQVSIFCAFLHIR